jgi:hypothetical protein
MRGVSSHFVLCIVSVCALRCWTCCGIIPGTISVDRRLVNVSGVRIRKNSRDVYTGEESMWEPYLNIYESVSNNRVEYSRPSQGLRPNTTTVVCIESIRALLQQ